MATLDVRILGPLQVEIDGVSVALGGPKQRSVLAMLALSLNRVVSTDRLIDGVWGDEAHDRAGATLQVYVSNLRKLIGADRILTQPPGYLLKIETAECDFGRFEALVADGDRLSANQLPNDAAERYGGALRLWRGSALSDLVHEPFAETAVVGLDERREAVREAWFDTRLQVGQHLELIGELEAAVSEAPLRERRCGQLMLALYRSGRQADSLKVFSQTRHTLVEELGIDPGPDLRRLESLILDQDRSLDWRPPTGVSEASTTIRRAPGLDGASLSLPNGTTLDLSEQTWVIGRAADNGIVLASPDVSRQHSELRPTPDGWVISDRGSTNGTQVNDQTVLEYRLADGDEISIGRHRLVFHETTR